VSRKKKKRYDQDLFERVEKITKAYASQNPQDAEKQMLFARELIRQIVFDSNVRTSASQPYSRYNKETILSWLQNPQRNETNLRRASVFMYLTSMHYQRLIAYYAGIPLWQYVISPFQFIPENIKDSFEKQFYKTAHLLELMTMPETMRMILIVVLREGIFYGARWKDKNSYFVQRIPPEYCRVTSISDGTFLYSVDMSKIPEEKLKFYPPEFEDMYLQYLETGDDYQEVPSEISVCVKADPSTMEYSLPPFAAILPKLFKIAEAEDLAERDRENNNYKMIGAQSPVDSEGRPLLEFDEFLKYYSHLANAVGDRVGLAVTPFKLHSFNFDKSGNLHETKEILEATSNYWMAAGTSGLLHGITNATAGVTKLAIKNDESYVTGVVKQVERLVNRYLKAEMGGTTSFKINLLPTTIFNIEEWIDRYKSAASFGIGKSYYMAAVGISQYDILGLGLIEKTILNLEETLTPLKSSYTTSSESGAGRPESDEEDLSGEGESTRANDANGNR